MYILKSWNCYSVCDKVNTSLDVTVIVYTFKHMQYYNYSLHDIVDNIIIIIVVTLDVYNHLIICSK